MKNRANLLPAAIFLIFVILTFAQSIIAFATNYLWFMEVGYVQAFLVRIKTYLALGIPVFVVAFLIFYVYLKALRKRYEEVANAALPLEISKQVNRWFLIGSAGLALFFDVMLVSSIWFDWLGFLNATPFHRADPLFGKDISFYFFTLPLLRQILAQGLMLLMMLGFLTLGFMVLLSNIRPAVHDHVYDLNEFRVRRDIRAIFNRSIFSNAMLKIGILGCLALLLVSLLYVISVYSMVYAHQGVTYGANFTDVHITLPGFWIKAVIALIGAGLCLYGGMRRKWKLMVVGPAALLIIALVVGVSEAVVQKLYVVPDERTKERPYISRTIEFTRAGYGLENITNYEFPAQDSLTRKDLDGNQDILSNIRINDTHPLKQTVNQLQAIRLYYEFNDVDIDRYMIDGQYRQVFIAAREMNLDKLQSKTWVNQHLQFTHGYGAALAPVNQVTPEGQPELMIKNVPPVSSSKDLTIKRPEIYFGESTNDYIIADADEKEFDYPKGSDNVYVHYQGSAGIKMNLFNRVLFSLREHSSSLLLSGAINGDSRIIINRNIIQRASEIMPFLRYDQDPYLVINPDDGKLYWIIDAYTASNRYPYSRPNDDGINYIRNSVKVVVDAYNGKTDFYVFDNADPVVKTYQKIFGGVFKPSSQMPQGLLKHIQYPKDLLNTQADIYRLYHVTNPDVFYNSEDAWDIAQESYMDQQQVKVAPNYVMFRLPDSKKLEFLLNIPFTPKDKSNMNALLMARNDVPNYGKLFVYRFPKDRLVQGPQMVDSRINQDTDISRQLTLWDQKGSSILRGNLMAIPIKDSILYVKPIYLKAAGDRSLPEMKRVIVAYGDKVAMDVNLPKALDALFGAVQPPVAVQAPSATQDSTTSGTGSALVDKARQLMQESAQKLDELKKVLDQLQKEIKPVQKP